MGIGDFLKRKKIKPDETKKAEDVKNKPQEVEVDFKEKKKIDEAKIQPSATNKKQEIKTDLAYRVLKSPQVTEKATNLTKKNQYIFKIFPRANKSEVKKAVNELYGVDVLDVKIIKVPAKKRRLGKISGWRKGYKKAIVKIKEGQKIEVLPR